MKFLIIRFSSIGDIVLTTPVIRCLKKQVGDAEVHYLTKNSFRAIIDHNPYVDKAYYLQENLESILDDLKRMDFDYIIDLHHNIRTMKVKKALKKPSFSFNKLNAEKYMHTNFKWNTMPDIHIVDRYLQTVATFGVKNDRQGLDYFIPDSDRVKESDIPASHHAGYIALVIGAAHDTKKMPVHKLTQLCTQTDHPIILLGGKDDVKEGKMIAAVDPQKIYNACGKFTINESADLVRRAKLVISHDTGLMHIAAAFKKPVISLWGNTTPAFGMYPYYPGTAANNLHAENLPFDIIEVPLPCRPCSKIGHDKCPLGHLNCMNLISVESIVQKAMQRLGRS
jgi:ADP-heptose:LPS heptosyltransferase